MAGFQSTFISCDKSKRSMLSQKWKCGRCHLLLGYRRYRSGLIGTSDYSPGNFQGRITKPIQRVACVFWSPMGRPIYIRCKSIIYTSWWRVFPFFFFFSFHVLVCCLAGLLCLRFWLLFSCCLPWIMRSSWTHVSIQTTMVLFFFVLQVFWSGCSILLPLLYLPCLD